MKFRGFKNLDGQNIFFFFFFNLVHFYLFIFFGGKNT